MKIEIRLPIRILNPISLSAAFGLAKLQEEYGWSSCRALKSAVGVSDSQPQLTVDSMGKGKQRNNFQARRVSSMQMDEKKRNGLCCQCEEKWNPVICARILRCTSCRSRILKSMKGGSRRVRGVNPCYLGSPSATTMRLMRVLGA